MQFSLRIPTTWRRGACALAATAVLLTASPVRAADVLQVRIPPQGLETSPSPVWHEAGPHVEVPPALRAVLDEAFQKALAKSPAQPKGLSVAVLIPGQGRWTAQLGEDGRGQPITVATRFHAASSGKLVTAALVAAAVERGQLDLGARIESYVPDLPARWRAIPLGMLLNHTSGLGSFDGNPKYDRAAAATPRELLGLTPAKPLFPVGSAHRYSNTGYILLGLALEKATGLPWAEQVRTEFFGHMRRCDALLAPECEAKDLAAGYAGGKPVPFLADYRNVFSCGGIVCSPIDLARLYDAILNGRLISAAARDRLCDAMVQVQSGPVSVWAGRGINRVETPKGGFLLHQGGIPGFTCMAGVSLRTGAVVAVMANDASVVPDDYFFGLEIAAAEWLDAAKAETAK